LRQSQCGASRGENGRAAYSGDQMGSPAGSGNLANRFFRDADLVHFVDSKGMKDGALGVRFSNLVVDTTKLVMDWTELLL
jgi:hypothetical protein